MQNIVLFLKPDRWDFRSNRWAEGRLGTHQLVVAEEGSIVVVARSNFLTLLKKLFMPDM